MSRSALALRWFGFTVLLSCLGAAAWLVGSPTAADAQNSDSATFSIVVSEETDDQLQRTAAVALDPARSGIAAVTASVTYNTDQVIVASCSVSEVGACNDLDGAIKFSVFNLSGLTASDQLLTIDFAPKPGASGVSNFELVVDTAVDGSGADLPDINLTGATVDFGEAVPTETGSLTGDVIDDVNQVGLFAIDVCAVRADTETTTCTTTTGRGTWRIDDLAVGDYTVLMSDPGDTYASATIDARVTADQVTAGIDVSLAIATEDDEVADTGVSPADVPVATPPVDPGPVAVESVYEASISGTVQDVVTRRALGAMQVCATQPLVLHQSCAATDVNGEFKLGGLSSGNYFVTVVDPRGRYPESTPKLVGVVGDQVQRTGVKILLNRG